MSYDKGRLIVEQEGYYYLYSKVQLNAADDCVVIQHEVVRDTNAYGQPIPLMKSKRFVSAPHLTSFLCRCTWVKSLSSLSKLLFSLFEISCCGLFPLVSAARPRNLQVKRFQEQRICGTVSWLGFSTCRVATEFLSTWTITLFVQEQSTTPWGLLWYLLRNIVKYVPPCDHIIFFCVNLHYILLYFIFLIIFNI